MSKKGTKALASAALMSLVLTTALSAGPVEAASSKVTRTSGADRYATAAEVAKSNWTTTDNVVLVSGEGYADSVSASALAKKLDAPILLTTPDTLSSDAESAIKQLKPKHIYVIGGNASISQSIRNNLKTDYDLVELGGANRYETNVAVAKQLVELGVSASDVLVVGGEGFSDALSVAPVAAAKGQILLLANNNEGSIQSVIDFVKDNSSKVTVVGTKNVINDAIYNALGASTRVDGGADRFATNVNVLNKFEDSFKKDKLYIANASPATPDNLYADALVASALAGKYTAPLVLIDKDTSTATSNALTYLAEAAKDTALDVNVIGGTGVVSETLYGKIEDAVKGINPTPDNEVNSISAVNLNQIKVVFSDEVDEDTAEEVANYKVDGTALVEQEVDESGNPVYDQTGDGDKEAKAVLQDDNKTVLITLGKPRKQSDDVDITVKKGILSADKSQSIPEYSQSVTFSDTTTPTIESVKVRGNSKITVKFSEPLNLKTISTLKSKFKIDGQNISSLGLDESNSKIKDIVAGNNGEAWADEVDFYFSSKLASGNRTLKVSDGDDKSGGQVGLLSDAAGFPFKESTEDFNVDEVTGEPTINSIKAEDNGKVYINFDRPMDAKTATKADNYEINGKDLPDSAKVELKEDDTQVKISGVSGILNKNSNTLYIDDNVKDAYGNKVAEDTYKSFDLDEDDTKPAVDSVQLLDDDTIRVRFSKDVNALEATDESNYKIKDKSGTDISEKIEDITIPGKSGTVKDGDATDVVDINFEEDLTDTSYTITIKNITDTTSSGNEMDEYTQTVDGAEDIAPEVDGVTQGEGTHKVVVQFSKEMDASSIQELSNYKYRNGNGDLKALPSDTEIEPSSDNKCAIIEFPSNYTVRANATEDSGYGDNDVIEIDVLTGVQDVNGNALEISIAKSIEVAEASTTVKAKSVKVYYDEDDDDELKVDFKFTKSIDVLDWHDFKLNGQVPDTGYKDGEVVTLVYNTEESRNAVKAGGINAKLELANPDNVKTTDVSGQIVAVGENVVPYYYKAAPKTISDPEENWTAEVNSTVAKVNIVFDTPIYTNSVNPDDFTFRVNGKTIDADNADVSESDPKTVVFTFKNGKQTNFEVGKKVRITANTSTKISTLKDLDGEYAYYVPSDDDRDPIEITIDAGDNEVDKTALNSAITKAGNYKEADYTTDSYKALTDAVTAANALSSDATQAQVDAAAKAINDAIAALVTVSDTGIELNDVTAINLGLSYMYEIDYATVKDSVSSVKFYDAAGTEVTATPVSLKDGKFTTEDETATIKVFDKDGKQIAHAKVLN